MSYRHDDCHYNALGIEKITDEISKIMGHHSNEIQVLLGYISKSEVVHKDDMVEV